MRGQSDEEKGCFFSTSLPRAHVWKKGFFHARDSTVLEKLRRCLSHLVTMILSLSVFLYSVAQGFPTLLKISANCSSSGQQAHNICWHCWCTVNAGAQLQSTLAYL